MVSVLVRSRSQLWLLVSRLASGSVFHRFGVLLLFPVPFVRGWRIRVRASCSADPTSLALTHRSAMAQTRERNCWKCELNGLSSDDPGGSPVLGPGPLICVI